MATAAGGSVALSSFPSAYFSQKSRPTPSTLSMNFVDGVNQRRNVYCLAVQESSSTTSTVAAETKEKKVAKTEKTGDEPPAAKPKAAAKAPAKPLPQLMEEDIIPSLKTMLAAQQDTFELELTFGDNTLEGSFVKKGIPYTFWAFFPDGINGAKGFSLSSYSSVVSTVEPFLVDEKKPTARLIVFWIEKRLAAQGIIPVWQE